MCVARNHQGEGEGEAKRERERCVFAEVLG